MRRMDVNKQRSWLAVSAMLALSLVILAPARQTTYGQTSSGDSAWSTPVALSSADSYSWFPDIAADPYGDLHVAWASGVIGYDSVVYSSSKDGLTWETPNDVVAMPQEGNNSAATRPSILVDANGNLDLSFVDLHSVYFTQASLWNAVNALAWAPLQTMSGSQTAYFSKMAIDSKGIFHYFYTQNSPSTVCSVCYHLYYRQSTDAGNSWTEPVDLIKEQTGVVKPQVIIDSHDNLHVAWETGQGGGLGQLKDPTAVAYAASYDSGKTWSTPFEFPLAEDEEAKNITLGIDANQHLVVAWLSAPSDWVMYQVSDTSGATWSDPQPIPDVWGGVSVYPTNLDDYAMASDSAGGLHLVMVGRLSASQQTLDLVHLVWDGSAWSTPDVITSYTGDAPEWPRIAVSNGNQLNVAWFVRDQAHIWDSENGRYRVWYAKGSAEAPFVPNQPVPSLTPTSLATVTATASVEMAQTLTATEATATPVPVVQNRTPPVDVPTSEMDYLPMIGKALIPTVAFAIIVLVVTFIRRR